MFTLLKKIQNYWSMVKQRHDYQQTKTALDILVAVYENKPQLLRCIETYQDAVTVANRFNVKITDTKLGFLIHLYSENRLPDEVSKRVVEIVINAKPRRLKILNIMKEFGDIPVIQCLPNKIEEEYNWLREQ